MSKIAGFNLPIFPHAVDMIPDEAYKPALKRLIEDGLEIRCVIRSEYQNE